MSLSLSKYDINRTREFLGRSATQIDVAEALNVPPKAVQRRLTPIERKAWATEVRAEKLDSLHSAIRKIRVKYLSLGKIPSARESGVHSSVMTEHGGYTAILRQAGLEGLENTMHRAVHAIR